MKTPLSLTLAITFCAVIVALANTPEPEDSRLAQSPHGAFDARVQPRLDGIGRMRDLPPVELPSGSAAVSRPDRLTPTQR